MDKYFKIIKKSVKNGKIIDKKTCKTTLDLLSLEIAMTKVVQAIKDGTLTATQARNRIKK